MSSAMSSPNDATGLDADATRGQPDGSGTWSTPDAATDAHDSGWGTAEASPWGTIDAPAWGNDDDTKAAPMNDFGNERATARSDRSASRGYGNGPKGNGPKGNGPRGNRQPYTESEREKTPSTQRDESTGSGETKTSAWGTEQSPWGGVQDSIWADKNDSIREASEGYGEPRPARGGRGRGGPRGNRRGNNMPPRGRGGRGGYAQQNRYSSSADAKDTSSNDTGESPWGVSKTSDRVDEQASQGGAEEDTSAQGDAQQAAQKKERPYFNPERVKTGGAQRDKLSEEALAERMTRIREQNEKIKQRRMNVIADEEAFKKSQEEERAKAEEIKKVQEHVDRTREQNARRKLDKIQNREWDSGKQTEDGWKPAERVEEHLNPVRSEWSERPPRESGIRGAVRGERRGEREGERGRGRGRGGRGRGRGDYSDYTPDSGAGTDGWGTTDAPWSSSNTAEKPAEEEGWGSGAQAPWGSSEAKEKPAEEEGWGSAAAPWDPSGAADKPAESAEKPADDAWPPADDSWPPKDAQPSKEAADEDAWPPTSSLW